jgi:hypothetical protein
VCNPRSITKKTAKGARKVELTLAGKLLCPDVAPLDSLDALDALDRQQQLDQERQRKPVPSQEPNKLPKGGRTISQQKHGDHGASNASPINLAPPRVSSDRRMICHDQKNNGISVDDIIRWL